MTVIEPLDHVAMWARPRPGEVAPWVRWTIAVACVVTIAVVGATANVLWRMDGRGIGLDPLWFQAAPPIIVAAAIALGFAPPASTSRFIRLAIVLPVIHVLAMLATWAINSRLHLMALAERTPLVRTLPVVEVTLAIVAATAIAASVVARKRREWIHAAVTIALAHLLLLGLWLPLAAGWLAGPGQERSWDAVTTLMASPGHVVLIVLVPPFAVACGYAALTQRAPHVVERARVPIASVVGLAFACAIVLRFDSSLGAYLLYDNVIHVVLATAFVAIAATAGLAATTWFAGRTRLARLAHPERRSGVVDHDGDDDVVACLEISSWLRGPRVISRSFVATTERGIALPVPGDAEMAATLPLVSSVLRTGEAVVVMRTGDAVDLSGYIDRAHGDGPFRGASMPVPGPRGITVGRAGGSPTTAAQSMGLAAWRPAVAYLLIATAVALPGLVGVLAPTWK